MTGAWDECEDEGGLGCWDEGYLASGLFGVEGACGELILLFKVPKGHNSMEIRLQHRLKYKAV